jgi:hypothetical protein
MYLIEYYSSINEGLIKSTTSQNDIRNILKSHYIYDEKINDDLVFSKDIFNSLNIEANYNKELKLIKLILSPNGRFIFKDINLCSDYRNLVKNLKLKEIPYFFNKSNNEIIIGKNLIAIIFYEFNSVENANVKNIVVNFCQNNLSLSFDRFIENDIPSKKIFNYKLIKKAQAPKIAVYYEQQKYFANHGKSKATKKYLEMQKNKIDEEKVIDVMKKDIEDIKSKTSSFYAIPLKNMLDYAKKLNPNDFILK